MGYGIGHGLGENVSRALCERALALHGSRHYLRRLAS
jgi:hypothetical protein